MEPTKWLNPLLPDGGRENVKYLILWTFPGQVTLKVNETRGDSDKPIYYCDLRNRFRKVMEGVFWEENPEIFNDLNEAINDLNEAINDLNEAISFEVCKRVYELQKEICTKYGIALRDRVAECYLLRSSKDTERLPKKYHNFYEYIIKPNKDGKHIVVLLNWVSEGEELKVSAQLKRDFENGKISKADRKKLKKWMNYCLIDPSFLVPKQSTSSSNRKWIREILDDWRKDL